MAQNKDIAFLLKIVFILLFLPIFLVWLTWKKTSWPKWAKWLVTCAVAVFYIGIFNAGDSTATSMQNTVPVAAKQAEIQNSQIESSVPLQTPQQKQIDSQSQTSKDDAKDKQAETKQSDNKTTQLKNSQALKTTQTAYDQKQTGKDSSISVPTYIAPTTCGDGYYKNSDGICVHSPSNNPSGATAECRDGTYSYSLHRSGTCSGHGGVAVWF